MESDEKLKEGIQQILQIIREDRDIVVQTRNHLLKVKRGLDCIDEKLKLGSYYQKNYEIPISDLVEKGRGMIKETEIKILFEKIRKDSELSYEISKISKNQEGIQTYCLVFNDTREFEKYQNLITTQYNIIEPIYQKLKSGEDINLSLQLVQELNEEIDIIIMEYGREREKFICDMNNRGLLWSGGRNLGEYEIERKEAVAISRKIRELVDKYQRQKSTYVPAHTKPLKERSLSQQEKTIIPDNFAISIKDREIWVNNWLISKPHAVGSNFEFFEHIRLQNPHTKIGRETLPDSNGSLSLKEQVKNKSFIKILNGLGFKGGLLKAFFYGRGRNTLTYRGDKITKDDLEKAGVKISLFLKELELAHIKNSPE